MFNVNFYEVFIFIYNSYKKIKFIYGNTIYKITLYKI